MSECSNCFSGCVKTTSDQCVKYTGADVPELGIVSGQSLASVELAIFNYITTLPDGTLITPTITATVCDLVGDLLTGDSLNEYLDAIIGAICSLDTRVTDVEAILTTLNDDYDVDCLSGVTNSSDTHAVLQAAIDQICQTVSDVSALEAEVVAYAQQVTDLNNYIASYLAGITDSTKMYTKMVPYAAVPYFGAIVNYPTVNDGFTAGVGFGAWEKVYLCNGQNGTPDLRALGVVGATVDMGGGALDPIVTGLTYTKDVSYGEKAITLDITQIPSHTHTAAVDGAHTHTVTAYAIGEDQSGELVGGKYVQQDAVVNTSSDGSHSHTISNVGGGLSHNNVSPARACYYIMYIP